MKPLYKVCGYHISDDMLVVDLPTYQCNFIMISVQFEASFIYTDSKLVSYSYIIAFKWYFKEYHSISIPTEQFFYLIWILKLLADINDV